MKIEKGTKVYLKEAIGDAPVGAEFVVSAYAEKQPNFTGEPEVLFFAATSTQEYGKYITVKDDAGVFRVVPSEDGTPRKVAYFEEFDSQDYLGMEASFRELFEVRGSVND